MQPNKREVVVVLFGPGSDQPLDLASGGQSRVLDSFIPGAISNRTLEHLTESSMRPCRAIRGDQRQYAYTGPRLVLYML